MGVQCGIDPIGVNFRGKGSLHLYYGLPAPRRELTDMLTWKRLYCYPSGVAHMSNLALFALLVV